MIGRAQSLLRAASRNLSPQQKPEELVFYELSLIYPRHNLGVLKVVNPLAKKRSRIDVDAR